MISSNSGLTVVVVAHDDSQTLLATIERLYRALTITVEDFAIIIFDDGSSDDTRVVADAASRKFPFITVRRNERPKGAGSCTIQGSTEADFGLSRLRSRRQYLAVAIIHRTLRPSR